LLPTKEKNNRGKAMLVFVGCNYENLPFRGYRDAFRELQDEDPRIQFRFADVRITNKVIMDKVREEIANCDVGLYDVTFRNPNVMMELGVAIGAGKEWNILYNPTKDRSAVKKHWFDRTNIQLPANLRGFEYLEYSDKPQLKRVLTSWAAQVLEQSAQRSRGWANTVEGLTVLLTNAPGLSINELASKTGQHVAMTRLTLSELRKKGYLRTTGRGPATRYYVSAKAKRSVIQKSTPVGQSGSPASPTTRD
jgi:nucleoside 2-deoxyribosyltransferase